VKKRETTRERDEIGGYLTVEGGRTVGRMDSLTVF